MEGFKHQSLVVLALLSVLLVNLQALDQVRALDSPQDSLPSLVIDDGDEPLASDQSSSKDKDNSPKSVPPVGEDNLGSAAATAASEPAAGKDNATARQSGGTGAPPPTTPAGAVLVASGAPEEPKPISNNSDQPTGKREDAAQPAAKTELNDGKTSERAEPTVEAEPVAKQAPKEADLEQQNKSSQSLSPEPTVASAAAEQSAPPSSPTASSSKSEQDIKSLLENKNDAENDLSSSPVTTTSAPVSSSETSTGGAAAAGVAIDLDGPVDTNKPVDDRFHYSLGNPGDKHSDDSGAKPPEEKPVLEGKKDAEQQPVADKNEDKDKEPLEPKKIDEAPPVAVGPAVGDSAAAVKPVVVKNDDSPIEAKKDEPVEEAKPEGKPQVVEPKVTGETLSASPGDAATGKPADEQQKESSLDSKRQEAGVSLSTTTAASVQPDAKAQQPQASEKPSSASAASNSSLSATDVALGSALGSAVGSILTKAQPAAASKPTIVTIAEKSDPKPESTSKAPAIGSASTTGAPPSVAKVSTTSRPSRRSSTTDRWNRWSRQPPVSTSTSTVAPSTVSGTGFGSSTPPTRRRFRPTRRRYRPYNRFGPFPWGGVDSYTPLGADEAGLSPLEPEFDAPELPLRPTTTSRPKRRSSTTTEVPSTKSSRGGGGGSSSSRDEPSTSSRRGAAESSHKRRHHNHNHDHRGHEYEQGSHHGHRNHGHRFDGPTLLDGGYESPSFFSIGQPGSSHRPASGFSLFNSGAGGLGSSTGSGFDLLNPFTWLDEVTKPRPSHNRPSTSPLDSSRPPFGGQPPQGGLEPPTIGSPARPPGHRPIPVEGEYGSSGAHHHGHEHHQGQGVGHRPHRPHGDREDYDDYHDHHHDGHHGHHNCHEHDHEHDYDHDNHHHGQRRPVRPHREPFNERPVVGGGGGRDDYDTYPPSHGGRRPARPYQTRRDQSDSSSNSNSSSRESELPRPIGGERLEGGAPGRPRPERPETSAGPRRAPSMVSPFDSLFGSLNDDFFGGLRSSFIDSPMKAAAETIRDSNTAFDALISSPKILMPSFVDANESVRVVKPAQAAVERLDQDNKNLAADSDELREVGPSEDKDAESRPGFRPRQDKPNLVKLFRLVL